jgi:uncharacterized protein YbjT (DUF2867 family)
MAGRKIIAVVGATGAQGGGLVRALLNDKAGEFTPRAITRKASSEKARALAALGAEVVEADLDQPETLGRAFDGAYGAYCVTNFWEHYSGEKEFTQAGHLARAAKEAGLEHVIWSTLEDTRKWVPLSDTRMPTLQGKYKVAHFDAKGEADAFFQSVPTTFLLASFYWENFIFFGSGPTRGEDGKLVLILPIGERKMAGIAAEDIGKCAAGIFRRGTSLVGQRIGLAGEHLTGREMADQMAEALGEPVRHVPMDWNDYRALGFPGADDVGNMFQIYHDFADQLNQTRSVEGSRALNPELQNFRTWLSRNKDRIPR